MKMRGWLSFGLVFLGIVLMGCGQKWSPACKTEATLSAPFAGLNLPVADGRVCEADDKKARLEFQGSDKEKARVATEQAVMGSGFAKESCAAGYCIYTKGPQRLQIIVGTIANRWVTTSLILTTAAEKKTR
jgi:hypothetical protein